MRICVLGGTRFIGRAIVDHLMVDHEILVVHRGQAEPEGLPDLPHLHADRNALDVPEAAARLAEFDAEAVIDCMAIGAADTESVLAAFPDPDVRMVVLSSMDVYRAFGAVNAGRVTDAVPIDETSPVRAERYPYRGRMPDMDDYDKLDVEERWVDRGGAVARLPMVTGPRDYQRRQEYVLRRIRHGRSRMPFGAGNALFTQCDVADIARGVGLLVTAKESLVAGEIYNFGEARTPTVRLRTQAIIEAVGSDLELVVVPDDSLPDDLGITRALPQPIVVSSDKAVRTLGWELRDQDAALAETVRWHLTRDPDPDSDFSADDEALAGA